LTQVDSINPGDVVANSSFDKLQDNTAVVDTTNAPNNTPNGTPNSAPNKPAPSTKQRSKAQ
jgi:hypothetical protein